MIISSGVVNSGERVVNKVVSDFLINEIVFSHSIFEIWNGMK